MQNLTQRQKQLCNILQKGLPICARPFAEIAKDKTAVIVTHRLGSVKFANRIVVIKAGKIAGVGSHDKLLSSCPLYADMWESQAQYYTTSDALL